MIKVLHLSDIHLGSGFSYGRLNPETGLNTRFEDFVAALSRCIDRAITDAVDLVLFGGDAFPDATPPPIVHQAFASQFRRLADANIPTVLLVGNHDQHTQGQGGASLSIYQTLRVPGFIVGDRLETHTITTASGPVQVITLPWLTRSALLTRPETEGLAIAEIGELLLARLRVALEGEIRQLNPDLPTILLGHLMTDTARFGAERFLAVGKGFTVPMALLARPCFDYVALGHVHRHQVLGTQPPVIYPGSIERVDFSEEHEDKGYMLVNLQKGATSFEFCPLPVRRFHTIRVDVTKSENPMAQLLKAIASEPIDDAVVRVLYQIRPDQLPQIETPTLQQALASAHVYSIHPELVSQLARPRVPELGVGNSVEPLDALRSYLANHPHLNDLASDMLEAAQRLLTNGEDEWSEMPEVDWSTVLPLQAGLTKPEDSSVDEPAESQLRLL